jgi:hypothetical protein
VAPRLGRGQVVGHGSSATSCANASHVITYARPIGSTANFGVESDYAIANSVFTHISLNDIRLCLYRFTQQLAPGGRFIATFFEAPRASLRDAQVTFIRPCERGWLCRFLTRLQYAPGWTATLACSKLDLPTAQGGPCR